MNNPGEKNRRRIIKENPFVTSDAVLGEDFFGRKEEIHQAMEFLGKRKEHHLLIHGQRRIGKTSLLLKIKELVQASQTGKATYFDLQNKARLDISDVLLNLAFQIDSDIDAQIDINKNDFIADHAAGYFKNTFLPRVFEKLPPNCPLILLFDEFDSIGESKGVKDSPKITNIAYHKFIPFLTEIKEMEFPLKFIFAVGRNYKDLDDSHYGQITKAGNQVELSYFSKPDLGALIKSSDGILPFAPGAIDRVYDLTGGQPFFSQCLASSAFDRANKQNKKSVTPRMIDDQIESTLKKYAGGGKWLWEGFNPHEKIILYLMARVKEDKQIIDYKSIHEMAARLVLLPAVYALDEILEKLITFKIIRVVQVKQVHYNFYVEFFRKWLVVENTLDKIRILLNKLDTETENFLMNGKFYYMKKDYHSAEEYFLKVIEKFPSHYEALYYLGLISTNLIEKNIEYLDSALDWFSRAYQLNSYGTKDEYLDVLKQKLTWLENNREETENLLMEIQKVNPGDLQVEQKLVERWLIKDKDISSFEFTQRIKELNLGNKQIRFLPPLIRILKNLEKLDISNNEISDITIIKELPGLKELNLKRNQVADISPLMGLTALTKLDLRENQIADISPLMGLTVLTKLDLRENQIADISPLGELNRLVVLNLGKNQLSDISIFRDLKRLKRLDLSNNRISSLPVEMIKPGLEITWKYHVSGKGIFLEGNPLEIPPVEIVKQGTAAVRNYLKELKADSVHFLESKLLIVGSGEVGKTTLMRKLKDNRFTVELGKEPTTHGINIVPREMDCIIGTGPGRRIEKVKLHFWDFGGQDIYHATHQFFLTKRSLYLFVWEARKEEESRGFDYWLNIIKLLSAGSPVIVVMNKADLRIKLIDEASFKEKFENIAAFLQVSCLTGKGIVELAEQIRLSLSQMPHLHDKLPKVWMDIRSHLKKEKKDYISLNEYYALCRTYGLDEERAEFLSGYLHDLGVILHFHRDPLLKDTVILNPEWATSAVYSLMDTREILENKGRFKFSDLEKYWDAGKFPREKHPQLIRLLEKFQLCFNFPGTDIYIVPELLSARRPSIGFKEYQMPETLNFQYRYDFMPGGIIPRFISRMYYLIKEDHYWRNGVELIFEESKALVTSDFLYRKIKISVFGSSKFEFLAIIKNEFEHIHRALNMEKNKHYSEMIPCPCPTCAESQQPHLYDYETLRKFSFKGISSIYCPISVEDVPIDKLLRGAEPTGKQFALRKDLLKSLITSVSRLQRIAGTIKPDEDSRNAFLALLLSIEGFIVKENPRWGRSASGKSMGQVDIQTESPTGEVEASIESFILKNFYKTLIDLHLEKLFRCDPGGQPPHFLVVYSEANNFQLLWQKYLHHLPQIDFRFKLLENPEEEKTSFGGIRLARTKHLAMGNVMLIYHLFVNMNNE